MENWGISTILTDRITLAHVSSAQQVFFFLRGKIPQEFSRITFSRQANLQNLHPPRANEDSFSFYRGFPKRRRLLVVQCSYSRAGGNGTAGTAGTAMAVPVLGGEKWRRLDSNLTCVRECPLRALRRNLGRRRGL